MTKRTVFFLCCAVLSLWIVSSCSSKSKTAAPLSSTRQAAASASAAQGALSLSSNVGTAAGSAEGYLPPQVQTAPGKTSADPTAAIANIDPRLKDAVDKMRALLRRDVVAQSIPKPGIQKTLGVASICAPGSGTGLVTDAISTGPSGTTHTFTIQFVNCRDTLSTTYTILSGSITGTYYNNSDASREARMHIDLTASEYSASTLNGTVTMNGDFSNQVNGTATAGQSAANGSFVARYYVGGDVTMSFLFSNVSDTWTSTGAVLPITEEHTGNGSFGLTITNNANGQSIGLTVALTNVADTFTENVDFSTDEWINGTVHISWTPDLSQWGCLHGDYVFTTAAGTPIHTSLGHVCPTSGTLQVNNARLDYGVPNGEKVTVTLLPNGSSEVFADCDSMGAGMCQ